MRPPSNAPSLLAVARARRARRRSALVTRAWRIAAVVFGVLDLAAVLVVALLRGAFAGL